MYPLIALEPAARILNIVDNPSAITTCYHTWLKNWHDHMKDVPAAIKVPSSASYLHTPLIISSWTQALVQHPNQPLVNFFLEGISKGFRIGFNKPPRGLKSAHKNLSGVLEHPQVVEEYMSLEILCLRSLQ